jgi:streptogramin lyase
MGTSGSPTRPGSFPGDITAGADGNLWFLEASRIAKITTSGQITELAPVLSIPFAITTGPDGNVWFVERFNQRIGKVTPAGQFTFYTTSLHTLESIVTGADGNLWFTSFGDDAVGRITPAGVLSEGFVFPGGPAPTGLARGPLDSNTLWFLGYGNDRVYVTWAP